MSTGFVYNFVIKVIDKFDLLCYYIGALDKRLGNQSNRKKDLKNLKKVLDKSKTVRYNKQAPLGAEPEKTGVYLVN